MILVKKFYFDLIFNKLINGEVSIKVVLYIQEFEVDFTTKRKKNMDPVKPDINTNRRVNSLLRQWFYHYTGNDIVTNYKSTQFDASNFINKQFAFDTADTSETASLGYHYVIKDGVDNWLLNTNVTVNDEYYLYMAFSFNRENVISLTAETCVEQERITDISKINFKDVLIKPLLQEKSMLNKKRQRDDELPERLRKTLDKKVSFKDYRKYKDFEIQID
jgi:hypothetical protein